MPNNQVDKLRNRLKDEQKKVKILEELIETKMQALYVALQKSEDSKTEQKLFLMNVSHELRTPLHAIMNFSKIAIKKLKENNLKNAKECMNHVYGCSKILSSLIEDLIDLSKLEFKKMKFVFDYCNIFELVEKAILDITSIFKEKNQQCIVNKQTTDPIVYCDMNRIYQVILNLLTNASKFSPPGSVVSITISNQPSADKKNPAMTQVEMHDQGPGIAENELSEIFEHFYQSPHTKQLAGSGLGIGLSICKQIIKEHQGLIWAENDSGGGARFIFAIPRDKCDRSMESQN